MFIIMLTITLSLAIRIPFLIKILEQETNIATNWLTNNIMYDSQP